MELLGQLARQLFHDKRSPAPVMRVFDVIEDRYHHTLPRWRLITTA
jgi:hypothetical protein